MDRRRRWLTFREATDYLIEAKVIPDRFAVGASRDMLWLSFGDQLIEARLPDGRFSRDALNRAISWERHK
jgi:hypothetical protein